MWRGAVHHGLFQLTGTRTIRSLDRLLVEDLDEAVSLNRETMV